jgi:hypothetical protein
MRQDTGQRRRRRKCDDCGKADAANIGAGADQGAVARTAMRALVATGTCLVRDARDQDGLTRPMLRRLALRLAASDRRALRDLGTRYLHGDPPTPEDLAAVSRSSLTALPASAAHEPKNREVIDLDPDHFSEVFDAPSGRFDDRPIRS